MAKRDELKLRDVDYIPVTAPERYYEIVVTFRYIGLRPFSYQLGHWFFDTDSRKIFMAKTQETLTRTLFFLGTRTYWLPTIDEILRQCHVDNIRVEFSFRGDPPKQIYRTLLRDPFFHKGIQHKNFGYISYDPWFAVAFPVARNYRQRFEELGLEYVTKPIYTDNEEEIEQIAHALTDQS